MEPIAIAMEAAYRAGELILERFHQQQEIHWKGPADIVTQVDHDAEDLIVNTIRQVFPHHDFLGEEGHTARQGAEYVWVIDPLDGTKNYAAGIPFFCTSIALAVKGQTVLGVVHDALHGETFSAEAGKGTCLNGKKVSFIRKTNLEQASLSLGLLPARRKDNRGLTLPMLVRLHPMIEITRLIGSAALALAYVACGRLDITYHDNVSAWDILAGALLVEESGGVTTEFTGQPISLASCDIIAANVPAFHAQALRVAQEVLAERRMASH